MVGNERVKVVLNRKGVGELLKSKQVQKDLQARARRIQAKAGPGNNVTTWTGKDRVHARVTANTARAQKAEAKDRALTRAITAGR